MSALREVPLRWSSIVVLSTLTESDVDRAISHAMRWGYDGVQVDLTKANSNNRTLILRTVLAAKAMDHLTLPVLVRVTAAEAEGFIEKDQSDSVQWNIVVNLPADEKLLSGSQFKFHHNSRYHYTIRLGAGADLTKIKNVFSRLKTEGFSSIHLEFPFIPPRAWREREIVYWVEMLELESGIDVLPPLGFGLEDPTISADDQVLPEPEVILVQNETAIPRLSVIIPTYEKTVELTNTLRHLLRQKISNDDIELIIVDCGSHDTTVGDAEKLFTSEGRNSAVTLLKISRPVRKRRGEIRYRAGLARNVGAARARAPHLLFLDDDVLMPADFLNQILAAVETSPNAVFLAKCHTLRSEIFGVRMNYESIKPADDTESPDRGFWRDFYERHLEWMSLARPWRFLATHTLALSKDLFVKSGRFRENFAAYGFEDMELGYRLAKCGADFKILPVDVYRQNRGRLPETPRARLAKHVILARAAQVFYRHTLERDVFVQVHQLFRRPLWFWLWYDRVKTGGPLWRLRRRQF